MVPQKRPLESAQDLPERPEKLSRIDAPTTAADKASPEHDIKSKDGDSFRRLRNVNRSVMSMFEEALKKDPSTDLSTLLESYAQIYPHRRKRAEGRVFKPSTISNPQQEITTNECLTELIATSSVPKAACDPKKPRLSREAKRFLQVPPGIPKIVKPLTPSVLALLTNSNRNDISAKYLPESFESSLLQEFSRVLSQGEVISYFSGTAIVRLSETIIVKLGANMDLDHVDVVSYIRRYTRKVPIPEPLGVFTIGNTAYSFVSYVEGTNLDKRWPGMDNEQKRIIQTQLDTIMEDLRQVPLPPPSFGLGWHDRCKDTRHDIRRHTRQSGPIVNEAKFNEFLLSNSLPRVTKSYLEMLHSKFRDDHQVVLTHGELHPRNIIVADDLTIKALIGWDMSGLYPEYWEYIKALNAFTAIESKGDDWWRYLPKSIGLYHFEWALDCQLENIICCE